MPDDFASPSVAAAGVTIRGADPERDAAACAAIYAPNVTDSATSFELEPPDEAELGRRIAAYARHHQFLVAEGDDAVLGYAYAGPFSGRAAYRWATETSVYVDSRHQGEGLGRALYAELFDRLRRQGFHAAGAGITLPNAASVRLHESMGFEPVGVYPNVGFKLGAWHDVGWWWLRLLPADSATPTEPLPPSAI